MNIRHSAFRAVPQLRDKIVDPHISQFRFLDHKEIDRRAREAGYAENWRRPDDEREAIRHAMLRGREGQDVWVFAYGSLMWDPGFFFEEVQLARAVGYHRRFCLHMKMGRGSAEYPGLMAALDVGQYCDGLIFRIASDRIEAETAVIWRREMISYGYVPKFVPVQTEDGEFEALTFVIDRTGDRYADAIELDESARMIATARGINGTNLDYVDNLAAQLKLLGLEDPHFEELHQRTRLYV